MYLNLIDKPIYNTQKTISKFYSLNILIPRKNELLKDYT